MIVPNQPQPASARLWTFRDNYQLFNAREPGASARRLMTRKSTLGEWSRRVYCGTLNGLMISGKWPAPVPDTGAAGVSATFADKEQQG